MNQWGSLRKSTGLVAAMCLGASVLAPGEGTAQTKDTLEGLLTQMQELRLALTEMRDQLASSHRESQELRRELQVLRDQLDFIRSEPDSPGREKPEPKASDRVSALAEQQELLSTKVQDQYQTKVESGSKYLVRLSGLALLNVFSTRGSVDNVDLPRIARPRGPQDSNGSFGVTARQSLLNVEVFGPKWRGARTGGDLAFDLFGGFPSTSEGITSGLARLRTARLTFDWANTSVVAGQDTPFFSPLSPTSLASTAAPALSYSGNLWTWTPQVHLERRLSLSDDTKMLVQWGILDPLTGELPAADYNRTPTAGERSRVPAYAVRLGWQRATHEHLLTVGTGGYYSRQNWGFGRTVDAWAATVDWDLPLGRWFSLSGEAYRGRAIGGLGGGVSESVLFSGSPSVSTSSVLALNSAGGWSQLTFKPVARIAFHTAFGEDYPFRSGLSSILMRRDIDGAPASRNATAMWNVIYQAQSNLLFSVEYRRLWTSGLYQPKEKAGHVNLSAGIIF